MADVEKQRTHIEPPKDVDYSPSWENRRKVVFASLLFCALIIAFIVYKATILVNPIGVALLDTALTLAFGLSFSIIGFYVGGVAWQDTSIIKAIADIKKTQIQNKPKAKEKETEE